MFCLFCFDLFFFVVLFCFLFCFVFVFVYVCFDLICLFDFLTSLSICIMFDKWVGKPSVHLLVVHNLKVKNILSSI